VSTEAVAHHEAGHAVVARLLDFNVEYVTRSGTRMDTARSRRLAGRDRQRKSRH